MNSILIEKQNLDVVSIIESNGVHLSHRYGRHVGLCPFHSEKTPSFYVYDDGHFHCFGCGSHGDVIDFIQQLHGCDFKEAIKILGISADKPTIETRTKIIELEKKREELKRYRQRERELAFTLGTLIRWTYQAISAIKTIEDLENFADYLHALPFWKHCHEILCHGDAQARREVVSALQDMDIIERNLLFKSDFNFSAWLSEFKNGARCEEKRI